MNLREKTKRDAFEILTRSKKQIIARKYPVAQAATSLYISCIANGEKINQKKFAAESKVNGVIIRNRIVLIKETKLIE